MPEFTPAPSKIMDNFREWYTHKSNSFSETRVLLDLGQPLVALRWSDPKIALGIKFNFLKAEIQTRYPFLI